MFDMPFRQRYPCGQGNHFLIKELIRLVSGRQARTFAPVRGIHTHVHTLFFHMSPIIII